MIGYVGRRWRHQNFGWGGAHLWLVILVVVFLEEASAALLVWGIKQKTYLYVQLSLRIIYLLKHKYTEYNILSMRPDFPRDFGAI